MEICKICNRKLKDPLSIRLKVGPKCRKKINYDPELFKEIQEHGMDGELIVGGIQLILPGLERGIEG